MEKINEECPIEENEKTWNFMKQESNWDEVVMNQILLCGGEGGLSNCSYFSELKDITALQE